MRTSLLLFSLLLSLPAPTAEDVARTQVRAAAEAMGGEARLRALTSLRIQGIGHWNLVEQSERPEPPWLTMYEQLDETRDLRRGRLRQKSEGRGALLDAWQSFTLILADDLVAGERGGKMGPDPTAGALARQPCQEAMDFQARGSRDLLSEPPARVVLSRATRVPFFHEVSAHAANDSAAGSTGLGWMWRRRQRRTEHLPPRSVSGAGRCLSRVRHVAVHPSDRGRPRCDGRQLLHARAIEA